MGGIVETAGKKLEKTFYLNYGRDIVAEWCRKYAEGADGVVRVLDLGCGQGADLINVRTCLSQMRAELHGIDCYGPNVEELRQAGIDVLQLDIESQPLPFDDGYFDLVIANQFIEHTKEIFWIFGEISRALKAGGLLVVGVPNLLSLHNRVLMFFGQQPLSIDLLGPHIRGLTIPGFRKFIETGGYFKVLKVRGSNFYPFPPWMSRPLSRMFPSFAVTIFFLVRRQDVAGSFVSVLHERLLQTPYFKG